MNEPILEILGVLITPWKLVGYAGVFLFAGRWVVQVIATGRQGRPVIPGLFWSMSVVGSALLLTYFVWGKNDSVGVLSNLFPMMVALFNLRLHRRELRREVRDGVALAPQHNEAGAGTDEHDAQPLAH